MTFKDFRDDPTLSPAIAALMQATVDRREAQGFNVHFINLFGEEDRYSFSTAERADKFRAFVRKSGRKVMK